MLRLILMSMVVVAVASPALAQVVYEPIQYQYGGQNPFYYGGSDPRVFERASIPASTSQTYGRVHGFDFVSGNVTTHREVCNEGPRIYTDAVPNQNARYFGFNASDARNEANANAATYFRKSDVLYSATFKDGVWVVPATAQPSTPLYVAPRVTTAPSTRATPRPLMIIPKKSLEKADQKPTKIAAAQ